MAGSAGGAPPPISVDAAHRHLERFIGRRGLHTVFQPIVDLRGRRVAGFEALSRFRLADAPQLGPERWFQLAVDHGVGDRLEAAAIRSALDARRRLPDNCFLTVNVDPLHLTSDLVLDEFRAEGGLGGIVVEFTEHRAWDLDAVAPAVEELRRAGALIAIDDAGAGHSGLRQILELRPTMLKLDRSLVAGIDRDESKVALVEMVGVLANRLDAWVLAEGVETAEEARRLDELEVPLSQGYFFAEPAEPWAGVGPRAIDALGAAEERHGPTLHRLVDPVGPVWHDDPDPAAWLDEEDPWRPVVDGDRRPLGVIDAESIRTGTPAKALVANVHSSPQEIAQRLTTALEHPGRPILVTDDTGRYVGLVSVRRLLRHLAGDG